MKNAIGHCTEICICSEEGKFRELNADIEQDQAAKKNHTNTAKK